jgi:RND family efflux transporter MFP subunit
MGPVTSCRLALRPALVACLIVAAGGLAACDGPGSAAAPPPSSAPREAPRPVRLVKAEQSVTDRRVSATGTLAADEHVVLGTKGAGRLAELAVDLGSPVRRGQVIARLDPTDAQLRVDQATAALQQARARLGLAPTGTDERVDPEQTSVVRQARAVLDEAKLTRDRSEQLLERALIARAQLDTAVSALGVAEGRYQDALEEVRNRQAVLLQRKSELAEAQQQLKDTAVVSPVDGAVSERRASVGEYLANGAPVVNIVKIHPLRLRVTVPEREAAAVQPGQTVVVTVEGAAGEHRGRVTRLSPVIAEQSRTLLLEAEIPNERGALRVGAFAKAEIVVAGDVRIVTVPAASVVTFAGVEKVLSVKEGKAVEVRVRTGRRFGERVEVLDGIGAGTAVVEQPGNLAGGQPVAVQSGS